MTANVLRMVRYCILNSEVVECDWNVVGAVVGDDGLLESNIPVGCDGLYSCV